MWGMFCFDCNGVGEVFLKDMMLVDEKLELIKINDVGLMQVEYVNDLLSQIVFVFQGFVFCGLFGLMMVCDVECMDWIVLVFELVVFMVVMFFIEWIFGMFKDIIVYQLVELIVNGDVLSDDLFFVMFDGLCVCMVWLFVFVFLDCIMVKFVCNDVQLVWMEIGLCIVISEEGDDDCERLVFV